MDHCYYCPSFLRRHYHHHIDRLAENETITPEQWNRTSQLVRAHARSIGTFAYLGEFASPSMSGFELPRRHTTQQNSEVASANLEALCLLCRLTPGHTRYRYLGDPRVSTPNLLLVRGSSTFLWTPCIDEGFVGNKRLSLFSSRYGVRMKFIIYRKGEHSLRAETMLLPLR